MTQMRISIDDSLYFYNFGGISRNIRNECLSFTQGGEYWSGECQGMASVLVYTGDGECWALIVTMATML